MKARTIAACEKSVLDELFANIWRNPPRVPLPVDVEDAEAFPNIAAAREWARQRREGTQHD